MLIRFSPTVHKTSLRAASKVFYLSKAGSSFLLRDDTPKSRQQSVVAVSASMPVVAFSRHVMYRLLSVAGVHDIARVIFPLPELP